MSINRYGVRGRREPRAALTAQLARRPLRRRAGLPRIALAASLALVAGITATAAPVGATPTVIPVAGSYALTGLYCADAGHCLAVGEALGAGLTPFLVTLVDGQVSGQMPIPGGGELYGLTCPTTSTCYALGNAVVVPIVYGVVQPPIGITVTGPEPAYSTTLTGIACDPGTTNCVVVGQQRVAIQGYEPWPYDEGLVVPLTGGVAGTPQLVSSVYDISGVACPSAGNCLAVGSYQGTTDTGSTTAAVVPIADGTAGTPQHLSASAPNSLGAIACESTSVCWAATDGYAVPITDGEPGTPVAVPDFDNEFIYGDFAICPSSTLCYFTGGSSSAGGELLPVENDVPTAVISVPGLSYEVAGLSCFASGQCTAAGSAFASPQAGAFVTDVLPTPPPAVTSVKLSGTAAKPVITVTGTNFGDDAPPPSPVIPVQCVANDTSYDYPSGVLAFTDTTAGWSAGSPGSCVGLSITSWTNTKAVLTFGAGYVYPRVAKGDAFTVSLEGASGSGASSLPSAPAVVVTNLAFAGSGAHLKLTVTGSNFGTARPVPDPLSPPGCVGGDTSHDFGATALNFTDVNQGWTAGQSGDCIGLTIESWSKAKVVLEFGADYSAFNPVTTGDLFTMQILGTTFNGTA